jgi:hypothetical protein
VQLDRFLKGEESAHIPELQKLLRQRYTLLKSVLKEYCALGPITDAFNLQWMPFTQFVQDLGYDLPLSEIDMVFIATNANFDHNKLNSDRAVVRRVCRPGRTAVPACVTPRIAVSCAGSADSSSWRGSFASRSTSTFAVRSRVYELPWVVVHK